MAISHIELFSVPVTDQDRAIEFYVGKLGFELVNDNPMGPGMRWVQVRPAGSATAITLVTWFDTMPAGSTKGIVLESSDLDADIERLKAQGIETSELEQAPWGTYVTFDDPDSNGYVLQRTAR